MNFSGKAINRFFKLPDVEKDEYNAYISRHIDYQEILQEIDVPGTK